MPVPIAAEKRHWRGVEVGVGLGFLRRRKQGKGDRVVMGE